MVCPKCKKEIAEVNDFCPFCGEKIEKKEKKFEEKEENSTWVDSFENFTHIPTIITVINLFICFVCSLVVCSTGEEEALGLGFIIFILGAIACGIMFFILKILIAPIVVQTKCLLKLVKQQEDYINNKNK